MTAKVFYCPAHGVTLIEQDGERKIIMPQVGFGAAPLTNNCALLTCRNPQAGRVQRLDANGFNTGQFCEVEEKQ